MSTENHSEERKDDTHNTSWRPSVWAEVERLALTPEYKGSKSALLEDLVLQKVKEERQKALPATKRLVSKAKQLRDEIRQKQRNNG